MTTQSLPKATQAELLTAYARVVRETHAALTHFDQVSGDGDFGDNLRDGLDAAESAAVRSPERPALDTAAQVFLDEVGGTSGPLIGLLLHAVSRALDGGVASDAWAQGVRDGLAAIQRVGEAEPGDRTMVDALVPAAEALEAGDDAEAVAAAALAGARATAELRARRGRASYVGERAVGVPDPGAMGVALLFWALASVTGRDPDRLDPLDDLTR
jgi:dihydroxyacetone kinase-like protein